MTEPKDMRMSLNDLRMRAAVDPEFRQDLLTDPRAVLARHGIEVPPGVELAIEESTATKIVVALPPTAASLDHDEDALAGVTGGGTPIVPVGVWWTLGAITAVVGAKKADEIIRQR